MACLIATLNQESLWKTIKQVQSKPEDDESNLKHCFSRSNALFAFKHSITPYVTKAFTRSKLLYIEPAHATAKTTRLANSSSWPQQQALSPQNCDTITSLQTLHEYSAAKNQQVICSHTNSFGHQVLICSQPLQKLWKLLLIFQIRWRVYISKVYISSLTSSQDFSFKTLRCTLDSNRKVLNKIGSCISLPGPQE